jgi:hypothetical protein
MVVGAEEVVEKSGIYSDGIPREYRRDNGPNLLALGVSVRFMARA